MWIFQLLTYFSGASEVIGSLVLPVGGCAAAFRSAVSGTVEIPRNGQPAPGNGRRGHRHRVHRLSHADRFRRGTPLRQHHPGAGPALTPTETLGLQAYVKHECAYCHTIQGRGGLRVGPDLSNIKAKRRTVDYVSAFIKNPQSKSTLVHHAQVRSVRGGAEGLGGFSSRDSIRPL